ncbi:MAG: (d)CMP kinase, partial [Eubacterium sp.]
MNIALDGPAGAGKSSIAKLVAKQLSFVYLDTGAMYRTIALYVLNNQIAPSDENAVVAKLDDIEISLSHENGEQQIFLNKVNVSTDIRKEEVGKTASTVAKYGDVRKKLVSLQQKIASENDVIMDGR